MKKSILIFVLILLAFSVAHAQWVIEPTMIDTIVPKGGTNIKTITITNNGTSTLHWNASIANQAKGHISIPAVTDDFPRGTDVLSKERVPLEKLSPVYASNKLGSPTLTKGYVGYGFEAIDGKYVSVDTDNPNQLTAISSAYFNSYAGAFGMDSDDHMYFCNNSTNELVYVELSTGSYTTIGYLGSFTLDDMACDKSTGTMYGLHDNKIYIVNLEFGACTEVGPIGNTDGAMIAIAIDGEGNMWGHDIGFDQIWSIDKETGAGTPVGSTGFDANYAQSMAWDPLSNVVYLAAFNNSNYYYELRAVDTSTGATSVLGSVYQKEVSAFSFPSGWIRLGVYEGSIDPGEAFQDVPVYFYGKEDAVGTVHTCDILFEGEGVTSVTVPVSLEIDDPEYGALTGTVKTQGGSPIENVHIVARKGAKTYEAYTTATGVYTIEDMYPRIYTVDATAVGYNAQRIEDVEIIYDDTTLLDIFMNAPIMVVDTTAIDVTIPAGSTSTAYFNIENIGNGPLDFNINLYENDKCKTDYSRFVSNGEFHNLRSNNDNPAIGSSSFMATKDRDDIIIEYQTGYNNDGIGTGGVFSAIPAARFTATELAPYYDAYSLLQVNIHVQSADFSKIELKVYEGGSYGNPGNEVYSQDITTSVMVGNWTNIPLSTPIPLVSGNEYWIGYAIDATGDHPMSVDAGPMVADKGGWMYASGSWKLLPDLNPDLNFNWCIQGVVGAPVNPWVTIEPLSGTIVPEDERQISVMFDATDLVGGEVKTGTIEIVSAPDVGVVTIPVILRVEVSVPGNVETRETKLYANYPNPVLHTTNFAFSLKNKSHVKFSVYNLKGQLVETLLDAELDPAPDHKIEWDGTAKGKTLANGIYFYKLETDSERFLKKMVLMK